MRRCRHDLAYDLLRLCKERPVYASEIFTELGLKYPTIQRMVTYLGYRYSITPLNPDGTLPWEGGTHAKDNTIFSFPTKQYPYYITRAGEYYLGLLEKLEEVDQLAKKFMIEDYMRVLGTKTQDEAESIFLKPNRFVKTRARTVPKHPPKKPKKIPSTTGYLDAESV